ncbi:MAG: amidohydrolase family protein [Gammaproteobacteria bacterium]|nr:amidohydrolase family protein [Gammaproteobacteria bacterium]
MSRTTRWQFIILMFATQLATAEVIALRAGQLIDGRSDRPINNVIVLIENATIVAVGQDVDIPAAARVIDLGSATLLPGMIEAHAHPMMHDDNNYQYTHLSESSAYKTLRSLHALQALLSAGWTSVRIAGEADVYYGDQAIRQAIDEGYFTGPRLTGAGHYLSITGGGGDINYLSPEQSVVADGYIVDGVAEMRRAVRREIKFGSDWIKLLVTGAFMSANDNPRNVHFSEEEVRVAVEEARRFDVPVMAHAHSAEGVKLAVRAGVRSIEHGSFIDDEAIRLMKKNGTFLVPTMYIGDYYIHEVRDNPAQQKMIALSRETRPEFFANIGKAIRAGVKVTVGSDLAGMTAPSYPAREFAMLIEAGMTPMQAIQAGTRVNAELLGWEDRLGTIEVGKLADIIAVGNDPLNDITALERVVFVMLNGEVVKQP